MTWNDVNFLQYEQIKEIIESSNEYLDKTVGIIDILFNIDCNNLSLSEYGEYCKKIKFIEQDIPLAEIKDKYGKYKLIKELSNIKTNQFIDFQHFAKSKDVVGILSVFLIPENKEYLQDYDIEDVKEHIRNMSVVDVLSIYAFFLIYSQTYIKRFQLSILNQKKKLKMKMRLKRLTTFQICKLYYKYAKKRMRHIVRLWKCRLLKSYISFRLSFSKMKKKEKE
jgi:hypothetical protein